MTHPLTRRLRDPVHGLIRFDGENHLDCLAWQLIQTSAFQRLRRVKQLGFSEFVFPGATHTRFAHSIGVFATARVLLEIVERETGAQNEYRAAVSVLAALLHDVGHGPFSHTFEEAQKARGVAKKHERWSADIVLSDEGGIAQVLADSPYGDQLAKDIADLLTTETPKDIYHAIVSSSFDADRLDYLRRDRMMTGSGAGAIDFDWLMDNVRVADVFVGADDDTSEGTSVPTFFLSPKAIQAADSFLLARYHLYEQVYLHKTTRGMEHILGACLIRAAEIFKMGNFDKLNLSEDHPVCSFLSSEKPTVEQYLTLDDFVIWGTLERIAHGADEYSADLARRLLTRKLAKCLDVDSIVRRSGKDRIEIVARLRHHVKDRLDKTVFKDDPKLSIYGSVGSDDVKVHKRLSIDFGDGIRREIVDVSDVVSSLQTPKPLLRYYFLDPQERDAAIEFALKS